MANNRETSSGSDDDAGSRRSGTADARSRKAGSGRSPDSERAGATTSKGEAAGTFGVSGTNGTSESADPPAKPAPVGLLGAMWHYRWMCVGIVAVCVVLSVAVGFVLTPEPSATATIALKTPSQDNVLAPGSTGDASLARYTAQRARFVTSDAVLANVGAALGTDDLNSLRKQLDVQPSTDSNIITITASGTSRDDAVKLATGVTRAYGEETQKQDDALTAAALASIDESAAQVRSTITGNNVAVNDAAASTLGQLQQRGANIRTASAVLGDGVEFVVNPDESSVVTSRLPIKEGALGFILGLVIAGTVAYLRADSEAAARREA